MSIKSLAAVAVAAATVAVALPAAAQQVPNTGPYYPVDGNADQIIIVAGGTRARTGAVGKVTVIGAYSDAAQANTGGLARLDMAYEFQCNNRLYRSVQASAYDAQGGFMGGVDDAMEWEETAVDSPNELIRTFACDGTPPTPEGTATLDEMMTFYRGWLAGQ